MIWQLLPYFMLCGYIRDQTKRPVEKVQEFVQWMYDYLLVSEYLLTYIIMLFTGQEYIKAPKNANSDDLEKIVAGCENQAWDIAYLTNWSTLYSDTENYPEEFLFATNDVLLKRIFINCNAPYRLNGLLFNVFSKKNIINSWIILKTECVTELNLILAIILMHTFKN